MSSPVIQVLDEGRCGGRCHACEAPTAYAIYVGREWPDAQQAMVSETRLCEACGETFWERFRLRRRQVVGTK